MGSGKCQTFDLPIGNSEEPQRPLVFRGVSWRGARVAPWQSSGLLRRCASRNDRLLINRRWSEAERRSFVFEPSDFDLFFHRFKIVVGGHEFGFPQFGQGSGKTVGQGE